MKSLFVFCLILILGVYAKAFIIFGESVSIGQGEGRAFFDKALLRARHSCASSL